MAPWRSLWDKWIPWLSRRIRAAATQVSDRGEGFLAGLPVRFRSTRLRQLPYRALVRAGFAVLTTHRLIVLRANRWSGAPTPSILQEFQRPIEIDLREHPDKSIA